MKYNLPKGYLSSSACDLWEQNPNQYREKYYLRTGGFSSPYTEFGKWFASDIENNPDKYPNVPKYEVSEFPIKWVVEGVPVLGFIDSFSPPSRSIIEYKTSVVTGDGAWDAVKVRKWKQLPFYAMCVREMFGEVNPEVLLVVLRTEWKRQCKETKFGTKLIQECEDVLTFADGATESPLVFNRTIRPWELDKMKERLVRIAQEISDDYGGYQQLTP